MYVYVCVCAHVVRTHVCVCMLSTKQQCISIFFIDIGFLVYSRILDDAGIPSRFCLFTMERIRTNYFGYRGINTDSTCSSIHIYPYVYKMEVSQYCMNNYCIHIASEGCKICTFNLYSFA